MKELFGEALEGLKLQQESKHAAEAAREASLSQNRVVGELFKRFVQLQAESEPPVKFVVRTLKGGRSKTASLERVGYFGSRETLDTQDVNSRNSFTADRMELSTWSDAKTDDTPTIKFTTTPEVIKDDSPERSDASGQPMYHERRWKFEIPVAELHDLQITVLKGEDEVASWPPEE